MMFIKHGVIITAFLTLTGHTVLAAPKAALPLVIYDEGSNKNRPYIASGYEGNVSAITMNRNCTVEPHSGMTCWKVSYSASRGWGGVMCQSPPNDWGNKPGGWDLSGAKKLIFWARGDKGRETVTFFFGGLKGKPYSDSSTGSLPDIKLTKSWKKYVINLQGQNLTDIKTGFAWTVRDGSPAIVFYLDDITYE